MASADAWTLPTDAGIVMDGALRGAGVAVRVDAGTALVLREAYHKIQALPRGNHYALYDYVRGVAAKVAPVDTFFVGFLQGTNRVRYPYGYEDGKYDDPSSHIFGPSGPTAWLLRKRQTYRFGYDNGAVLNAGIPCGDVTRQSAGRACSCRCSGGRRMVAISCSG